MKKSSSIQERRNSSSKRSRLLPLLFSSASGSNTIIWMKVAMMMATLLFSTITTTKVSSRIVSSFLIKHCSKRRTSPSSSSILTGITTRRNKHILLLLPHSNSQPLQGYKSSSSLSTFTPTHQSASLLLPNRISSSSITQVRMVSNDFDPTMSIQHINLDKMKELVSEYETKGREDSGIVVIDVRGHEEVQATGKLSPHTYTLPLPYIAQQRALAMDEDDFLEEFGFPKPSLDETIVFTCKAGIRSDYAAQYAAMEGYSNLVNYRGGAMEWFTYN